jgi:hypothetical protein
MAFRDIRKSRKWLSGEELRIIVLLLECWQNLLLLRAGGMVVSALGRRTLFVRIRSGLKYARTMPDGET